MSKKHTLRRSVAGILAVLTVAGNMVAPAQIRIPFAPAAIVASARTIKSGHFTFDTESGVLEISGKLENTDNGSNYWGTEEGTGLKLPNGIQKTAVKKVILKSGTELPPQSGSMFKGFTALEEFVIEDNVSIKPNDVLGHGNLSNMFEGCTSLKNVDISKLQNADCIAYVDHMFAGCTALESVNVSNITGDEIGDGWYTHVGGKNPVLEAAKECKSLTDIKLHPDFIDKAMNNLGYSTPETLLNYLLKECPNKDLLMSKLLADYYGNKYEDANYTWSDDYKSCTATRKEKNSNKTVSETTDQITVETTDPTCTVPGKNVYTAKFTQNPALFPDGIEEIEIPVIAHTWGEWTEVTPADYDQEGEEKHVCELCGAEETRPIAALERTDISEEETGIAVDGLTDRTYDGTASAASVTADGAALTEGTDYEITFEKDGEEAEPVNAGTYAYTITGIGAYKGELTGELTIEKAQLTVKANDQEIELNDAIPELTVEITGFVNGETAETALSIIPGASTEADGKTAGEFEITVGGGEAVNYSFAYENGTLFVHKGTMDVVADDSCSVYDGEEHYITVTAPESATIQYKTEDGEYTDVNPTFTNAGNYTVYYKVTMDSYEDVTSYAQVIISKANIDEEAFYVSIEGWTEGEEANAPVASMEGATFTYSVMGEDNYTDEVPTTAGVYTVKATLAETQNYNAAEATADFEIAEAAPVVHGYLDDKNSVTFAENIMLNFRAHIDEDYVDGAYVVFTYNHYGETKTVQAEGEAISGGWYMFGVPLTASELCIPVTAELYLPGYDEAVDEKTGSAKDYCGRMINNETTKPGQKEALTALLNYGGYVQVNQGLNLDALAYDGYQRSVADVTIESANEFVRPTETVGGVTYFNAALLLKDQVAVCYAFYADSIDGVTFKINGEEVQATRETANGRTIYVINAKPVRMRNLDNVNVVTVETAEGTISFEHTALNYAIMNSNDDPENTLSNAMKAMYALREAVLVMNN